MILPAEFRIPGWWVCVKPEEIRNLESRI